jgi:hypothetical protein
MPENDLDNKKKKKKSKGLASSFKDNMSSFLPLIAGSLIGGLDTGVAAQEQVNIAKEGLRKADIEEREIALREGAESRREEVASGITPFQQRTLAIRERELSQRQQEFEEVKKPGVGLRERKHGLDIKKHGLTERKSSQLSDAQIKSLASLDETFASLDRINALKQSVSTGPFEGRAQGAAELVGAASPEFTQLRAETENTVAQYIKAISGAQASEREVDRLKRVAPTVTDDDTTFQNKMIAFRKIVLASQAIVSESIKKGQPLKEGSIDNFIDAEFGKESGTPLQSQSRGKFQQKGETSRQYLERLRAERGQ